MAKIVVVISKGKAWNEWHSYPNNSGPKITDYLPSDFQRDNYGGQTHLIFSEDGVFSLLLRH